MRKLFLVVLALILLSSCISTSLRQRRMVQQFASQTVAFTTYPEKILSELAAIREERGIFYANSFTDPELHLNELDAIIRERQSDKFAGQMTSSFRVLQKYGEGLSDLSSDEPIKSTEKLYQKVGIDLEKLIAENNRINNSQLLPAGIATLLTQTLALGSRTYLAGRQCVLLRRFVNQADTLVSGVCDQLAAMLASEGMQSLIGDQVSGVRESFRFYYTRRSPPALESDRIYIDLMKRLTTVRSIQKQAITTVAHLKVAHRELAALMNKPRNQEEIVIAMKQFYQDMSELEKIFQEMQKISL